MLLYIHVQKVHGSNLGLDTDYPNRGKAEMIFWNSRAIAQAVSRLLNTKTRLDPAVSCEESVVHKPVFWQIFSGFIF